MYRTSCFLQVTSEFTHLLCNDHVYRSIQPPKRPNRTNLFRRGSTFRYRYKVFVVHQLKCSKYVVVVLSCDCFKKGLQTRLNGSQVVDLKGMMILIVKCVYLLDLSTGLAVETDLAADSSSLVRHSKHQLFIFKEIFSNKHRFFSFCVSICDKGYLCVCIIILMLLAAFVI